MDKNISEDLSKLFGQICGYNPKYGLNETTILGNTVIGEEEGDEQDGQNGSQDGESQMPPMDDGMGGQGGPQGGDMGGGMPPMDNGMGAQGGDMGGGMPPMDDGTGGEVQTPEGLDPQMQGVDMGGGIGDGAQQPDDEVIDVTEITDSQEEIENDIDKIDSRFDKVIKAIGAFEQLLKSNDEKIESLKAEFEKRNPTQIEKLSMQTDKSYPFNVKPEDFWKEKEVTSNYSTENDDNGKEQGQYVITANDVAGATDWKAIEDSLDGDDFMYHQTLNKILNF